MEFCSERGVGGRSSTQRTLIVINRRQERQDLLVISQQILVGVTGTRRLNLLPTLSPGRPHLRQPVCHSVVELTCLVNHQTLN